MPLEEQNLALNYITRGAVAAFNVLCSETEPINESDDMAVDKLVDEIISVFDHPNVYLLNKGNNVLYDVGMFWSRIRQILYAKRKLIDDPLNRMVGKEIKELGRVMSFNDVQNYNEIYEEFVNNNITKQQFNTNLGNSLVNIVNEGICEMMSKIISLIQSIPNGYLELEKIIDQFLNNLEISVDDFNCNGKSVNMLKGNKRSLIALLNENQQLLNEEENSSNIIETDELQSLKNLNANYVVQIDKNCEQVKILQTQVTKLSTDFANSEIQLLNATESNKSMCDLYIDQIKQLEQCIAAQSIIGSENDTLRLELSQLKLQLNDSHNNLKVAEENNTNLEHKLAIFPDSESVLSELRRQNAEYFSTLESFSIKNSCLQNSLNEKNVELTKFKMKFMDNEKDCNGIQTVLNNYLDDCANDNDGDKVNLSKLRAKSTTKMEKKLLDLLGEAYFKNDILVKSYSTEKKKLLNNISMLQAKLKSMKRLNGTTVDDDKDSVFDLRDDESIKRTLSSYGDRGVKKLKK